MYGTKLHWNWSFFLAPSTPAASHISTTITSFSPPDYSRISHIKRAFSAPIIFRKAYSSPTPKNEDTILLQMFSLPTNILPKSSKISLKDFCKLVPSHTLIFKPYEISANGLLSHGKSPCAFFHQSSIHQGEILNTQTTFSLLKHTVLQFTKCIFLSKLPPPRENPFGSSPVLFLEAKRVTLCE